MKHFLAVYIGSQAGQQRAGWGELSEAEQAERRAAGMQAWMRWAERNGAQIVDMGTPLGKTKRASPAGIEDTKNQLVAYTIVKAESHEVAAKLFEGHPHFSIFPGDAVEILECLPMPTG